MARPDRPRLRRVSGLFALLLLATGALAIFERVLRPRLAAHGRPTGAAEWIWTGGDLGEEWTSFLAFADFEVDVLPDSAELLVAADEEYVVYLNGGVVGAGCYRAGTPLDSYPVGHLLVSGTNRLLVELRSARGVGGLLLRLGADGAGADGATLVTSNGSWRSVHEYRERLKWPGGELDEARPVRVWGRPPTGRWGEPGEATAQQTLPRQLARRRPQWAKEVRLGESDPTWYPLPAGPFLEFSLGPWLTFDFGADVTGFLSVLPEGRAGARGLFWTALDEPPEPRAEPPSGRLLTMVGQDSWTDAVPRRFRYVTVVALGDLVGARVFLLRPVLADSWIAPVTGPAGLLGLEPPALGTPLEDEFWSEFERTAGVGEGKGR